MTATDDKKSDQKSGRDSGKADGSTQGRRQWATLPRVLWATLLVLAAVFAGLLFYVYWTPSAAPQMSLDQVYALAEGGEVRFATFLEEDALIVGQYCRGEPAPVGDPGEFPADREPCQPPLEPFQAQYPGSDAATQQLIQQLSWGGAEVAIDSQVPKAVARQLATFLFPILFLVNLFGLIFLARGSGGGSGGSEVTGFGRMSKKDKTAGAGTAKSKKGKKKGTGGGGESGKVTFADVGGASEVVAEISEVTDYLKDPSKFEAYGAAAPKGVLLFGPPGCGKTLTARAVAGEAGVPFFSVSGAEFIESLVGVGAARVRDLFAQVRTVAPAIVFIDEIDAVGRKRSGEGLTGGEREQTVNQLLVEMDGFDVGAGIVLMGATNRADILDPALLRPGRFDRHVTLEPPDVAGREEILRLHATGKPLAGEVDLAMVAQRTAGFTGADLANVVNEAALLAIRDGAGTAIGMGHLREAIERVVHGPQRRGQLVSGAERRRLAYHEAGHAIVAAATGQAGELQRVSIMARGRGLGATSVGQGLADRVLLVDEELMASLMVATGGRAAEQLVFANRSTAAEDDLAKANTIAREMIGVHGMSDELGPLRVLETEDGSLGGDTHLVESISGHSLAAFDAAVRTRIELAQQHSATALADNREQLDALARALEDHETVEGDELERLLAAVSPVRLDAAAQPAGNGHATGGPSPAKKKSPQSARKRG